MLAACPPQSSRHLPSGWIIVPIGGLDGAIVGDGMVLVPAADSPGVHLIRARRALRRARPSLFLTPTDH